MADTKTVLKQAEYKPAVVIFEDDASDFVVSTFDFVSAHTQYVNEKGEVTRNFPPEHKQWVKFELKNQVIWNPERKVREVKSQYINVSTKDFKAFIATIKSGKRVSSDDIEVDEENEISE